MHRINAQQDQVQSLRDEKPAKLAKVDTKDNLVDLGTKLLDPDMFEQL